MTATTPTSVNAALLPPWGFKDQEGRVWRCSINVSTIARVRDTLGVDLMQAFDPKSEVYTKLIGDPVFLCNVLFAVVKTQADEKGVGSEAFGEALGGDALGLATDALVEGLAAFFPNPGTRGAYLAAYRAGRAAQDRAAEALLARVNSPGFASAIDQLVSRAGTQFDAGLEALRSRSGGTSTNVPASSVSTPAPSPSGS